MIPIGRSLPGFLTSSAHVATVSKPTKEKNTTDAPASTPVAPPGANGSQFLGSTLSPPAVITNPITASETIVTAVLNRADSQGL